MELREAIEEVCNEPDFNYGLPLSQAIATILNAVADGTLIPADQVYEVRDGYEVLAAKVDKNNYGRGPAILSEALEIRSADDVRQEGFRDGVLSSAVLAEGRYQKWHEGCGVECDASACADIAVGIRALVEQKGDE